MGKKKVTAKIVSDEAMPIGTVLHTQCAAVLKKEGLRGGAEVSRIKGTRTVANSKKGKSPGKGAPKGSGKEENPQHADQIGWSGPVKGEKNSRRELGGRRVQKDRPLRGDSAKASEEEAH